MPTPTRVDPIAPEIQNPVDVTKDVPDVVIPETPETDDQKAVKKLQKAIGRATAKRYEVQARAERAEQELETLRKAQARQPASDEQPNGPVDEDGEPLLTRKQALELARQEALALKANEAVGVKANAFVKAGGKIEGFKELVIKVTDEIPFFDRKGAPTAFLDAILECEDAPAVAAYLGENLDELDEFKGLTPSQMGRRLMKLEDKLQEDAKEARSAAPKPLSETKAKAAAPRALRDLSGDAFEKRRREQVKARGQW